MLFLALLHPWRAAGPSDRHLRRLALAPLALLSLHCGRDLLAAVFFVWERPELSPGCAAACAAHATTHAAAAAAAAGGILLPPSPTLALTSTADDGASAR